MELEGSEHQVLADLLDFREIKRSGNIPCSFTCLRGMLEFLTDPDSSYHKGIFAQDKIYCLYCASGWRSALSSKTVMEMEMEMASVAYIEGDFGEGAKAGGPIVQVDSNSL